MLSIKGNWEDCQLESIKILEFLSINLLKSFDTQKGDFINSAPNKKKI